MGDGLQAAGFAVAVLSAVFNGSFAALSKLPAVLRRGPDPVVFNLYVCLGVFLSSWLVIPFYSVADASDGAYGIAWQGVLAGGLFVGAVLFSFIAIPLAGLALAQAVWSGSAVLVSFLWGVVGPSEVSEPVKSAGLSALAVALLLGGIVGIVFAAQVSAAAARLLRSGRRAAERGAALPLSALPSPEGRGEELPIVPPKSAAARGAGSGEGDEGEGEAGPPRRVALGLCSAVCVGLFGGSVLVPMSFVPDKFDGIAFIPSFGIGAGAGGVLVAAGHRAVVHYRGGEWGGWHARSAVVPAGMAAGCIWNLGNVCQVWAMAYAGLAYGVAYPILQCALLIAGLLGIFVFKEITEPRTIAAFFAASGVLITGVALLGVYGPHDQDDD